MMSRRIIVAVSMLAMVCGLLSACTSATTNDAGMSGQVESGGSPVATNKPDEAGSGVLFSSEDFTVTIDSFVFTKNPSPQLEEDDPLYVGDGYTINYTVTFTGTSPMTNWQVPKLSTDAPDPEGEGEHLYFTIDEEPIRKGDVFVSSIFTTVDLARENQIFYLTGTDIENHRWTLLETLTFGPDDIAPNN